MIRYMMKHMLMASADIFFVLTVRKTHFFVRSLGGALVLKSWGPRYLRLYVNFLDFSVMLRISISRLVGARPDSATFSRESNMALSGLGL